MFDVPPGDWFDGDAAVVLVVCLLGFWAGGFVVVVVVVAFGAARRVGEVSAVARPPDRSPSPATPATASARLMRVRRSMIEKLRPNDSVAGTTKNKRPKIITGITSRTSAGTANSAGGFRLSPPPAPSSPYGRECSVGTRP